MQSIILNELNEHLEVAQQLIGYIEKPIEIATSYCLESLKNNHKILLFGNGGSASDAQHIASELVGRYKNERKGLPAIALNTDTSAMTAIANDYGYSHVFERQVEALANKGDVVIGISTGGTSPNVINAINFANSLGCKTIGLSGKNGGDFEKICNVNIKVPADDTPRIQEIHILIGHIICNLIDQDFSSNKRP